MAARMVPASCRTCGQSVAPGALVCGHCGARVRDSNRAVMVGVLLILVGVGLLVVGLAYSAIAMVNAFVGCVQGCFNLLGGQGAANAPGDRAAAQMAGGMLGSAYGVEAIIAGVILCAVRGRADTSSGFRRKIAIVLCVFGGIGLATWIPAFLGVGPLAVGWGELTAAGQFVQGVYQALGVLLCLTSLAQIAAAAGVLKEREWGARLLRPAVGIKLALYLALWLVYPLNISALLGDLGFRPEQWVSVLAALAAYYWIFQSLQEGPPASAGSPQAEG